MDESTTLTLTINFSAATTAKSAQDIIESRLEKRQRTNYGPKNVCFEEVVWYFEEGDVVL